MSYNSGRVDAQITGSVTTSLDIPNIIIGNNVSGTVTTAVTHFTVSAGKIWKIYKIISNMSSTAVAYTISAHTTVLGTMVGTTSTAQCITFDLQRMPITLTAGQTITTGTSGAGCVRIVTIFYTEENA